MKTQHNPYEFPENPNRDYVRWFKKINHLNGKSNSEIKQIIAALKVKEKNQLIDNLNAMIDPSDLEFVEDEEDDAE